MIVDINETTAIEIEKNLKILSQSVSEIENLVKVSYYNFGKTESKEKKKNPYIVKSVIKNLNRVTMKLMLYYNSSELRNDI